MENGAPKKDATGAVVMQNKMDAAGNPVPEMKDGKPVPFILSYAADRRPRWRRSTTTTRRI